MRSSSAASSHSSSGWTMKRASRPASGECSGPTPATAPPQATMKICAGPGGSSPARRPRWRRWPRRAGRRRSRRSSSCGSRAGRRASTASRRSPSGRRSRPPGRARGSARAPPRRRRRCRRTCRARAMATRPRRCSGIVVLVRRGETAHASESSGGAAFMTSRKRASTSARAVELEQRDAAEHLGPAAGAAPARARSRRRRSRRRRAAPTAARVLVGSEARTIRPSHVDQLGGDEVVAGEAVLALEPARAAAERQPGDAGGGDAPAGGGQPVGLRGAVDVRPDRRRRRRARCGAPASTSMSAMLAQVEHDAVVAQRVPGHRVAAARGRRSAGRGCARHGQRGDHVVGRRRAARRASGRRSIMALNSVQASS